MASAAVAEQREPVTILVSIDGFHPNYLERGLTPTLSRLAAEGTSAAMRPSFPTKTFPNHWTLVTGLVPDNHGIIANRMEDAAARRGLHHGHCRSLLVERGQTHLGRG